MGEPKSKSKTLKINVNSTFKFLQVFNGILDLTKKEMLILSMLVDLSETKDLCSVTNKKLVAAKLGIEDYNTLNNYVKRLKDKKAIRKTKDGYELSPSLTPNNTNIQITYDA